MSLDTLTSEQDQQDATQAKTPGKPGTAKRSENFVFGIPQNGLEHKQREVLLDEPPPLGPNSELTYIGKPTVRYDGPAKAMGTGKYTADVHLPGMLYARMVDATIPHGRIVSIDTSAAEKLPGVRAVHVIEHVYGVAELRDPKQESPSRYPVIRYAGQPIAARSRHVATDRRRCGEAGEGAVRHHAVCRRSLGRPRSTMLPWCFPDPLMLRAAQAAGVDPKTCRRQGTSTGHNASNPAIPKKGLPKRTSSSRASTSPRCRRTPRSRPTVSWSTGSRRK